jgi:phosphoserine/homoserine phosphotransferase
LTANLPTFVCSDLEGVLIPEIWVAVAERTGIERLQLTTRDIADYDALMQIRMCTLREHGLTIHDVHDVIATVEPLPGAAEFVQWIRARTRFAVVTDSFYEFLEPIMPKLGYPTVFAHALEVDAAGYITGYRLRVPNSKQKAVQALELIGFRVMAFGDSYNDTPMLAEAELGVLFDPPPNVVADFPHFAVARTYAELQGMAEEFFARPPAPVTA